MLRRIGGRCSTHNMKVVFKVCCNETERNHITDHGPGEMRDTGGDARGDGRRDARGDERGDARGDGRRRQGDERETRGETGEETPGDCRYCASGISRDKRLRLYRISDAIGTFISAGVWSIQYPRSYQNRTRRFHCITS